MTGFGEGIGSIPDDLAAAIIGHSVDTGTRRLLAQASDDLSPWKVREGDLVTQAVELFNIYNTANRVEALFYQKGLPMPTVYSLNTVGFPAAFDGREIGVNGTAPFELFPPTDIFGHKGIISVGSIDETHTVMSLNGRPHPYEWEYTANGNRIVSFPLNVVMELIRRQCENGENPVLILTYIAGVIEGYQLGVGDIGMIMDDAEFGSSMHPGKGAHGAQERYVASRFQPKVLRSSSLELARGWNGLCSLLHIPTGPAAIMGTVGTPEFQSFLDMAMGKAIFEQAKKMGLLNHTNAIYPTRNAADKARNIFEWHKHQPSPLFGMGNTFELAIRRRTQMRTDPDTGNPIAETDIPTLALALITDSVGRESVHAHHESFVEVANRTADRNVHAVEQFALRVVRGEIEYPKAMALPRGVTPFSLEGSLPLK